MVKINDIEPGSIGEDLKLSPGDSILTINGTTVHDLIDYQLLVADENVLVEILRHDGERWDLEIEKDADDLMGLELEHPEPTQCGNNCIFCFVHQLPKGMRRTLYVKDEDYRFSFLYGSYVTLTNIGEEEVRRILDQRLSPLYVSVHATDEDVRTRMLGREGLPILELLKRLCAGGIEVHAQIVLCPGVNDGQQMERTIRDLHALRPGLRSLAVVPVGLTGYREKLPDLRVPTAGEAGETLEQIHCLQREFAQKDGSCFVFAADEFYLKAARSFPPLNDYEDLSQLENGVGLIPLFRMEAQEALKEATTLKIPPVTLVTGEAPAGELADFASRLSQQTGASLFVQPVRNDFFGGKVSVTGLLTGKDLIAQLKGTVQGEVVLLPEVMLKEGEELLLDDVSIEELEQALGLPVIVVESSPWGILYTLQTLQEGI